MFVIPTLSLLERVVKMINETLMQDRDAKGDLYAYLLSKMQHQGRNGQFRTPRHIIKMMVGLVDAQPNDIVGDPACETCGFLVAVGEHLREHHARIFHNKRQSGHFASGMFHGSDLDALMFPRT